MLKQIIAKLRFRCPRGLKLFWLILLLVSLLAGLGRAGLRAARAGASATQQGRRSLVEWATKVVVAPRAAAAAPLATLTVTSTGDGAANAANCPGVSCRLRDAIAAANASGADENIEFAIPANDPGCVGAVCTITLKSGQLSVANNGSLTINGPGANLLTISGNNLSRIFSASSGSSFTLNGVKLTAGIADHINGGAIECIGGSLVIDQTAFVNNRAGSGGAVAALSGCVATITRSIFSGNQATDYYGGGLYVSGTTATVTNSTFSGNTSKNNGGGLEVEVATLNLSYSTVAGNTATCPGGESYCGGGGIDNYLSTINGGTSIIANNTSPYGPDILGDFNSQNYNLIKNLSETIISGATTNNITGTDPQLSALGDYGGTTGTRKLLPGSPAIDSGNPGSFPATDQRGANRPFDGDMNSSALPDIGAFELTADSSPTGPNFIVNTLDNVKDGICDASHCSLRDAIVVASINPNPSTITFTVSGTIVLNVDDNGSNGLPVINTNITIDGGGNITISGNNARRIAQVSGGAAVEFRNITLTNGNATIGGGIYNENGSLTINNSTVSGNSASDGGGIYSLAPLTIVNSTITGNTTGGQGGGIYSNFGGLTINNSTVSGNRASSAGGAIWFGGASETGNLSFVTITGNITDYDDNGGGSGGGIHRDSGTLTVRNSIIVGNFIGTASPSANDCGNGNNFNWSGQNLVGSNGSDCGCGTGAGRITNPNTVGNTLGTLASNGGPTRTHSLTGNSPALSRIAPAECTFITGAAASTDQRGFARPSPAGGNCDIGAFEAPPPPPGLGSYPATSVSMNSITAVTPDAAPTRTDYATAMTTANFKGTLAVSPSTGIVRVTNAYPAGVFPIKVKAFGPDGTQTTTFNLTVTSGMACAGQTIFTSAPNTGVTFASYAAAVADFNNDGKQDAAISDSQYSVAIRLGNGNGTFTNMPNVAVAATPVAVIAIAVGDFNGDGNQDFATANNQGSSISVRLGNGSGGFTSMPDISFSTSPLSIATGDFNGDGITDIVATKVLSPRAAIFLGNGLGGFTFSSEVATGTYPESIVVGDFNSDGKLDIATANRFGSNVSIRFGDGNGNLTGSTDISLGTLILPRPIAIGDFNSDGKLDLVTANSQVSNYTILIGDGAGNFTPQTPVSVGSNPRGVAVGDFNADGKDDFIVTRSGGSASIQLGNGAGGFTALPDISTGVMPEGLAIGDFNGDGRQDFIFANYDVPAFASVRLGGCLVPTTTTVTSSANPSVFGQPVTFTATVTPNPNMGTPTGSAQFFDTGNPITGCTSVAMSGGQAQCTTPALSVGGNHAITAAYGGDSNFKSSSGSLTGNPQVVNKADTTVTITNASSLTANSTGSNQSYPVNWSVSVNLPGSLTSALTGNVTVSDGTDSCLAVVAAGTCNLTSTTVGSKTIAVTYTGDTNYNGGSKTTMHQVSLPPTVSKSFSPTHIAVGGTSVMTLEIQSPNSGVNLSGVNLTDNFPAGMVAGSPPVISTTTCAGLNITDAGGNSFGAGDAGIKLNNFTAPNSVPCVVKINVVGTTPGDKVNTTDAVTSTSGGTGLTATATLSVVAAPSFTKSFGAASIPQYGTTSLSFNIINNSAATQMTGVSFTDLLPSGLQVAASPNITGSCGGGTITASSGAGSISLSGATLNASGSCSFLVDVTATTSGNKINSVDLVTNQTATGPTATANLNVTACTSNTVVMNNADSGAGSLRQAIIDACPGSTITFNLPANSTITLTSGELVISKNLTIQGPGANLLTVQRSTAAGTSNFRLFTINAGTTVALNQLTLANGKLSGSGTFGGGIYNQGMLTLTNSTLSNNSVSSGSPDQGGGIYNNGTLTLTGSTLSNNSATGLSTNQGGGIFNSGAGTLTLTGSTLSGNSASSGSNSGGGIYNAGTLTVTNSTLSGNSASTGGPSQGGGIYNNGTLTLTGSTLSNNFAGDGINNYGGGIYRNTGTVKARNTLVAGNSVSGGINNQGPDVYGAFTSLGSNLIGNTADTIITGDTTGNILNQNALFAPLANNGGPTQTYALLPGSPALNAGTNCVLDRSCASDNLGFNLVTDQRGTGFNRQAGSGVDIGAFEASYALTGTGGTPQSATVNMAFASPLVATLTESGQPVSGVQLTFTVPSSGASATFPNGNTATTNASGIASVTVTANGITGSYQVTASAPGLASVPFSLSNTCPTITATVSGGGVICPNVVAQVFVTVNGGQAPYTVTLTNGGGTQTGSGTFIFNVSPASTTAFGVQSAVDANGCPVMANGSAVVTVNSATAINTPPASQSRIIGQSVTFSVGATGANLSYQWRKGGQPIPNATQGSFTINAVALADVGSYDVVVAGTCGALTSSAAMLTVTCPTITLGALPQVMAGTPFNTVMQASPAGGNYQFSGSNLPAWLSLAANGTLSGTPPAIGTFNFTISVTGFVACQQSMPVSVAVVCPTVTLTPAALPNVEAGTPYNQPLTATPAGGGYNFSLASGLLPVGIILSPAGLLSGTTTQTGVFSFRVSAAGFAGQCTAFRDYVLVVSGCAAVTVTPTTLISGTVSTIYGQTVSATPSGAYSFSVMSGALPPGLILNATTGSLTGTPTTAGTFNFRIVATAGSCSGARDYTITINCAGLTLGTLPNGAAGNSYNQTISVSPAAPAGSYTFGITQGNLPTGLSLNPITGAISGLPTVAGTYNFIVKAETANGCAAIQSYALQISCPTVTLSALATPSLNSPYAQTATAMPSGGSYSFAVTAGVLPTGLTLNSASGLVSGTPTSTGAYNFTITASGFGNCTGSRTYAGSIVGSTCPTITLSNLPGGAPGQLYSNVLTGTPSAYYSYAITAGSLPPGLSLYGAAGLIFGFPTANGTSQFTITATDSNNCSGERAYTVVIGTSALRSNATAANDFDGDGKSDLAVWRGTTSEWMILRSSDNQLQTVKWGASYVPYRDVTVAADYDGDGKTDIAIFRRGNGHWYIQQSSDGKTLDIYWGMGSDVPVPADYDGDGKADIAVWRGSEGNWYIKRSSDGQTDVIFWGAADLPYRDLPMPADYDGDGKADIAVFRQANGHWYIRLSSDGSVIDKLWGLGSDVPVPADYDGDGKTDIAVWRGADINWHILRSSNGEVQTVSWGRSKLGEIPVPSDYDGDGKADAAVWRTSEGSWYAKLSRDNSVLTKVHGQAGDSPTLAKSQL